MRHRLSSTELRAREIRRLEKHVRILRDRQLAERDARKKLEAHVRTMEAKLQTLEDVVRSFHAP